MNATSYEILAKQRTGPFDLTDIQDFRLREQGQLPADRILEQPNITLYSLDFEHQRAVFVETPADVNLSAAPFYFMTQYEQAVSVLTVSFDTMLQLAETVTVDDRRLIFIHSVGRSGSTLASQIFAQVPGIVNLSEPDALTLLVKARYTETGQSGQLMALLKATIGMLCKTQAETAWVIKGRSYVIELVDWLHNIYPQTKNLFLYRHAETWLQSCLRAYSDGVARTAAETQARENQIRAFMRPLVPDIAQYEPHQHLSHASILALVWLSAMKKYLAYHDLGIEMLAIRYANWQSMPQATAQAMLEYCHCKPADMAAIDATLTRDAQAGTVLSQAAVKKHDRKMNASDLAELHRHLQAQTVIKAADFELANTLRI